MYSVIWENIINIISRSVYIIIWEINIKLISHAEHKFVYFRYFVKFCQYTGIVSDSFSKVLKSSLIM